MTILSHAAFALPSHQFISNTIIWTRPFHTDANSPRFETVAPTQLQSPEGGSWHPWRAPGEVGLKHVLLAGAGLTCFPLSHKGIDPDRPLTAAFGLALCPSVCRTRSRSRRQLKRPPSSGLGLVAAARTRLSSDISTGFSFFQLGSSRGGFQRQIRSILALFLLHSFCLSLLGVGCFLRGPSPELLGLVPVLLCNFLCV